MKAEVPVNKIPLKVTGIAISAGISIGKTYLFKHIDLEAVASNKFSISDIEAENKRLDMAGAQSKVQLEQIQRQISEKAGVAVGNIFQVHTVILNDKSFLDGIKKVLLKDKVNSEYVIANQIKLFQKKFSQLKDETFRKRFLDVQDVYYRLLRNLLGIEHVRTNPLKRVVSPVVFVAERLIPSDLALLDFEKILGIVIEEGSSTSHVAIISKSLGIPSVINLPGITALIKTNDIVIIDGYKGELLVNPSNEDISLYEKKKKEYKRSESKKITGTEYSECITKDGIKIKLEANISNLKEAKDAFLVNAEGIGLLRTEFFYMAIKKIPTVDEECGFYKEIITAMPERPVTIRLLDLGADKSLPYLVIPPEENPQLGCRGIRFLFKHPELFNNHLAAIIRTAEFGKIKILIPFVSVVEDLEKVLELIDSLCQKENVKRENIRVGVMVEIPSAALAIDSYIEKADFISIGTNDLVQYLFAASRENGEMESYRQNLHPAALSIIKNVVERGALNNKEVSVCGEVASNPLFACLLAGLGVRSLSMDPKFIPVVHDELSKRFIKDLSETAAKALKCYKENEVRDLLKTI